MNKKLFRINFTVGIAIFVAKDRQEILDMLKNIYPNHYSKMEGFLDDVENSIEDIDDWDVEGPSKLVTIYYK